MRHITWAVIHSCLLFSVAISPGQAEESAPNSPVAEKEAELSTSAEDIAAIRTGSQGFVAAFNKQDAKAIAELWTADGEYVDDTGRRFAGREEIEKGYAKFFAAGAKAKIRIFIDSVRLLSDSAAIEDGHAIVDPPPRGAPGVGKYTAVHVKVDGTWLMATVRDSWVATASAFDNVADLEWLIGTWTAEESGATTESICQWIANKSFVQRNYKTTRPDGTTITGVQVIGWNPQEGHVQSWNFSSDGGHAFGIWSPQPGGWSAEIRGVMGDGTLTSAVNLLTKLDDDAYVWQSVQRTVGEISLPDTDEVVLKRQPANP